MLQTVHRISFSVCHYINSQQNVKKLQVCVATKIYTKLQLSDRQTDIKTELD